MEEFNSFITNRFIYIPFLLWLFVQIVKIIIEFIKYKKINLRRIVGAGGMPSSHSAIVCCLSMLVGREYGFGTGIFAISFIFALIVMYDAAGVRRAAGKQAAILNKIIETPEMTKLEVQEKLVEFLGHTPIQVFVGAILGIIVGLIF